MKTAQTRKITRQLSDLGREGAAWTSLLSLLPDKLTVFYGIPAKKVAKLLNEGFSEASYHEVKPHPTDNDISDRSWFFCNPITNEYIVLHTTFRGYSILKKDSKKTYKNT